MASLNKFGILDVMPSTVDLNGIDLTARPITPFSQLQSTLELVSELYKKTFVFISGTIYHLQLFEILGHSTGFLRLFTTDKFIIYHGNPFILYVRSTW